MQLQRQTVRVAEKGHFLSCIIVSADRLCRNTQTVQLRNGFFDILHRKGKVSTEKPKEWNSFTEYISDMEHPVPFSPDPEDHRVREFDDQRFASARPDVIETGAHGALR